MTRLMKGEGDVGGRWKGRGGQNRARAEAVLCMWSSEEGRAVEKGTAKVGRKWLGVLGKEFEKSYGWWKRWGVEIDLGQFDWRSDFLAPPILQMESLAFRRQRAGSFDTEG